MFVFITTCAMNKEGGGGKYEKFTWDYKKKSELLAVRKQILQIMKSSQKKPELGPDFGGDSLDGLYLPAYKRYSQGAFIEGLYSCGVNLDEWAKNNDLFFVSALYGLVNFREPIQNYDLDLTDEGIASKWKQSKAITKALLDYLGQKRWKIDCIIDCCGSYQYSELIDWYDLKGYDVRHALPVGDFQPRQVRWSCGHLAGINNDELLRLIVDEAIYHTANAVIRLSKELPAKPCEENNSLEAFLKGTVKNKNVAIACFENKQFENFIEYAKKKGWDKFIKFEQIGNLGKELLENLYKGGFRILIVHACETHERTRRVYKFEAENIEKAIPRGWQCYVLKPSAIYKYSYSGIEFELNLKLKEGE
jgi:hypothetical protein